MLKLNTTFLIFSEATFILFLGFEKKRDFGSCTGILWPCPDCRRNIVGWSSEQPSKALAQGVVDPQGLPKSMRQSTLSFLKGMGDQKQEFLGGKSGNEVVRESSERQLRKMMAPKLASGEMSEAGFQDMVSAYFDASKDEKDLLKELKKTYLNMDLRSFI